MPQVSQCPNDQQWQALMSGVAADESIEEFVHHIKSCENCTRRLEESVEKDSLFDAQGLKQTVDDSRKDVTVESLIHKMIMLHSTVESKNSLMDQTVDGSEGRESRIDLDFLDPPQNADEMGRLAHYRILSVLGSGGMGVVFAAEDTLLQRAVALKIMNPQAAAKRNAKERFLREARAVAKFEHEHIVPIYQVGEANGIPYLAMPLLKGMSIDQRLKQGIPFSIPQVLRIAKQAAEALAVAHEHGIVHRDIKPGNIWLEPVRGGNIRILDFGLALPSNEDVSLTQSGAIIGTPAYMSPEQAQSKKADHRSDLFSLGVVLYRMTTGKLPFQGDSAIGILTSVMMDTPIAPMDIRHDVPEGLSQLILQMLEKDVENRPDSASQVADRIQQIEVGLKPIAKNSVSIPESPDDQPDNQAQRRRPTWGYSAIGIAFAAMVLLTLSSIFYWETPQGTLRIEINDDALAVTLTKNGAIIKGADKTHDILVAPGDQRLKIQRGDMEFETEKFVLKKGDTVTLKVELLPGKIQVVKGKQIIGEKILPAPAIASEADRKAAKWVLSVGGEIKINDEPVSIRNVDALPEEPFRLTYVNLSDNQKITDEGLANFRGCRHVEQLRLDRTPVTDEGLANFGNCTNLRHLSLERTGISNEGLRQLQKCNGMRYVDLHDVTKVTDGGLKFLRDCSQLEVLFLHGTSVSDAGLSYVKYWPKLRNLIVQINGGSGLIYLKNHPSLEILEWAGPTHITDREMMHLQDCVKLKKLAIGGNYTDTGIEYLKKCNRLQFLSLFSAELTDKTLASIAKNHPELIEFGAGAGEFTDAGLSQLNDLKKLTAINLVSDRITDQGISNLRILENLVSVDIYSSSLTDASLKHLAKLPNLYGLRLDNSNISDNCVEYLGKMKALRYLNLNHTKLTDKSAVWMAGQLVNRHGWSFLSVQDTRISRGGFAAIKKSFPSTTHLGWSERNNSLAEAVLKVGGTVTIAPPQSNKGIFVNDTTGLISEYFQVRSVTMHNVKELNDIPNLISKLNDPEFDHLERLEFSGVNLPNLSFLRDVTGLQEMVLINSEMEDSLLVGLPSIPTLKQLILDHNNIRGIGIGTIVKSTPSLEHLSLVGNPIEDRDISQLCKMSQLQSLDLRKTRVTEKGIASLQMALPNCRINWDGKKN